MTALLPEPVPHCDRCGVALVLRNGYRPGDTGNGHTYAQRWCGVWYDHPPQHGGTSGHTDSVLLPSAALRVSYARTPRRAAA